LNKGSHTTLNHLIFIIPQITIDYCHHLLEYLIELTEYNNKNSHMTHIIV